MILLKITEVTSHKFEMAALSNEDVLNSLDFFFDDIYIIESWVSKYRKLFAKPLVCSVV
jgi:hypothetical protein